MKDTLLKLRIRRILWAQGYHCPLEVDLSHFEYEQMGRTLKRSPITDIDVLGIYFEPDLRFKTIVVDCKSGNVSEPNRLFWIRGLMDFFGAQEGILVKSRLHAHAKSLAPRLSIRLLDDNGLAALEKALDVDKLGINLMDINIHKKSQELWGIKFPKSHKPTESELTLKSAYQYLQYLYWMIEEYRNIQTIMDRFSAIRESLDYSQLKSKYLVNIGLQRLALSILKMASEVADRDITDIRQQSRIYLFGGPFFLREREQTIHLLNQLTRETSLIHDEIKLEPDYFDELVEIVNRIISNSIHASKILQHLDVVLLGNVLGSEKDIEKALDSRYSTDALVIAKRIARMFQKYSGFDERLLEEIFSL